MSCWLSESCEDCKSNCKKRFQKNQLYVNLKPEVFNWDNEEYGITEQYNYLVPVRTGNFVICDCWVVNKEGYTHPRYNVSPVPIDEDVLGPIVSYVSS